MNRFALLLLFSFLLNFGPKSEAQEIDVHDDPVLKLENQYFINWELFGIAILAEERARNPGKPLPSELLPIKKLFDEHAQEQRKMDRLSREAGIDHHSQSNLDFIEASAVRAKLLPLLSRQQKRDLYDQMQGYVQANVSLPSLFSAINPEEKFNIKYLGDENFQNRMREIEREYQEKIIELRSQAWKEIMRELDPEDRRKIDKMLLMDGLVDK